MVLGDITNVNRDTVASERQTTILHTKQVLGTSQDMGIGLVDTKSRGGEGAIRRESETWPDSSFCIRLIVVLFPLVILLPVNNASSACGSERFGVNKSNDNQTTNKFIGRSNISIRQKQTQKTEATITIPPPSTSELQ